MNKQQLTIKLIIKRIGKICLCLSIFGFIFFWFSPPKNALSFLIVPPFHYVTPPSYTSRDLPAEIKIEESWTEYEFEVGIPLVVKAGEKLKAKSLGQLVADFIYKIVLPVSGILAFGMILWGGIEYTISGGNVERQKSAQKKIIDALAGLLLLFGFWIILNTINPNILKIPDVSLFLSPYLNGGSGLDLSNQDNSKITDTSKTIAGSIGYKLTENYSLNKYRDVRSDSKATTRDLEDTAAGKCINPMKNSKRVSDNCIDKINWNKVLQESNGCITIDQNLLDIVDRLVTIDKPLDFGCGTKWDINAYSKLGCNITVGPFVSDHYYCNNDPDHPSKHAYGKAVDFEGVSEDKNRITDETCQNELAKMLCLNVTGGGCVTRSIQGITVTVKICYEKVGALVPHIHIELP